MQGQFGKVVKIIENDKIMALKTIKKLKEETRLLRFAGKQYNENSKDQNFLFHMEIDALTEINKLKSSYFAEFYKYKEDENYYYIYTSFIPGKTLLTKITKQNEIVGNFKILKEICEIFILLAKHEIVYLDFNKNNFIIDDDNSNVTLVDFGFNCGKEHIKSCSNYIFKRLYGENVNFDMLYNHMLYRAISLCVDVYSFVDPRYHHDVYEEMFKNIPAKTANKANIYYKTLDAEEKLEILEDFRNIFEKYEHELF